MNLFLAWVIVGVCCYYLERNARYKAIGKYGLVDGLIKDEPQAEDIRGVVHAYMETVLIIAFIAFAPLTLVYAIVRLWKPKDYQAMMKKLEEKRIEREKKNSGGGR